MHRVIIDGDWGGDEMQLLAVLLAHPAAVEVLGLTCVFGNTTLEQVTLNCGRVAQLLGASAIPYYKGAACPTGEDLPEGDGAHGADGAGGATMPDNPNGPQAQHAVDFILSTLRTAPEKTITITATGPLTNIAQAFDREPATLLKAKQIIVMGGCTADLKGNDIAVRRGNITPYAEFNFYMAPNDAKKVMESTLPLTLLPMNATHQLMFGPDRVAQLRTALAAYPEKAEAIIKMMTAADWIEQQKFGIPPVMHDVTTALTLLYPAHFSGKIGQVVVEVAGEKRGHTTLVETLHGTTHVVDTLHGLDALYKIVEKSIKTCITQMV